MARTLKIFKAITNFVRELSGENDYARYATRLRAIGHIPLSPERYYLRRLEEKYSRPCRCC